MDITYISHGTHTYFYPNGQDMEDTWGEIIVKIGCDKVVNAKANSMIDTLSKMGYKVKKHSPRKTIDEMLKDLGC